MSASSASAASAAARSRPTPGGDPRPDGNRRNGRILQILGFQGLERIEFPEAEAGDIIAFTGIDGWAFPM
jgi:translation elongation factor EF-G